MTDTQAKPALCPFCAKGTDWYSASPNRFTIACDDCGYCTPVHATRAEAIAAHNIVARAGELPNEHFLAAEIVRQLDGRDLHDFWNVVAGAVLDAVHSWRREREEVKA